MKKILVCLLALVVLCCSAALADHNHEYVKTSEVIEATCTTKQMEVWACECGEAITKDVAPANGHKYGPETIHSANGETWSEATCSVCGDVNKTIIEVFTCDHKGYKEIINNDTVATCTQDGAYHVRCANCGEVIRTGVTAHAGHKLDKLTEDVASTCTVAGHKTYVCSNADCDKLGEYVKVEVLPLADHDYSKVLNKVDSDCIHQGSEQVQCVACGKIDIQTIPAKGHKWDAGVIDPAATCTKDGVKTFTCTVCGETKTEAVPKTGHDIDKHFDISDVAPEWKAPTCADDGYFYRVCKTCGEGVYIFEYTRVPATGKHEAVDGEVVVEATCTTVGIKKTVCKNCGMDMGTVVIPAAHDKVEVEVEAPTCAKAGKASVTCKNCDYEAVKILPATGKHDYTKIVTKAATCMTHGTIDTTCSVCGKVLTSIVDPAAPVALGHQWYTTKVEKPVTCSQGSAAHQICLREGCKAEQDIYLDAAKCQPDGVKVAIEATCTTPAGYAEHCKVCGALVNVVILDGEALGHDFGDDKVTMATCTAAGSTSKCVRCGYTVARPALGHKYVSSVHDNNCGGTYTRYTCKNCGKKYSVAGKDSYVTEKFSLTSDVKPETVVVEKKEYAKFEVDDKTILVPCDFFAEEIIATSETLELEVVKLNGVATVKAAVVNNNVKTDVTGLLVAMGMICE